MTNGNDKVASAASEAVKWSPLLKTPRLSPLRVSAVDRPAPAHSSLKAPARDAAYSPSVYKGLMQLWLWQHDRPEWIDAAPYSCRKGWSMVPSATDFPICLLCKINATRKTLSAGHQGRGVLCQNLGLQFLRSFLPLWKKLPFISFHYFAKLKLLWNLGEWVATSELNLPVQSDQGGCVWSMWFSF